MGEGLQRGETVLKDMRLPHIYPQPVFSEGPWPPPVPGWDLVVNTAWPLPSELPGGRGETRQQSATAQSGSKGTVGTQEEQEGTCPPRGEDGKKPFPEQETSELGLKG